MTFVWQIYMIFLDLALLVVPLILMIAAYGRIVLKLVHGFRHLGDDDNASRRQSYTIHYHALLPSGACSPILF